MSYTVTTADAVRAHIITKLQELTPARAAGQAAKWEPVNAIEEVPSAETRKFYVDMGTPIDPPEGDAFCGGGMNVHFDVHIYTSYRNLNKAEAGLLRASDRNQLWLALEREVDPTCPGLIRVSSGTWQPEEETEGEEWGAHVIPISVFVTDAP